MPKHTRVYRCVHRLKKKHGLSAAIGICQKATKQSYRTGRTLRKRRRKRKRRGGNPIKWYKTWRRRQEGQRKRSIVRRNRKREQMVKEVAAQLWAEEPEEDFDANATARRLLRLSHWHPDMAMHYWYEAHPEQDTMRVVDRPVGAAPTSVPEGGARKKRKSRVRHHRSRKKRHQRRTRKKRGGAHIADGPPPETVEGVTTPAGTVVAAPPPPDPAQVAAEDFAAALEPIGAIPAPPMPFNPAQAATHIQARYRGNRDRWLAAHRREGLQRREARRQRRRERDETEAEQNALNMAPTGIFWLDRMRVAEAAAHAYATAPASVAEAAAAASFTGGRRRSRKKRHHRRRRRRTRNDN